MLFDHLMKAKAAGKDELHSFIQSFLFHFFHVNTSSNQSSSFSITKFSLLPSPLGHGVLIFFVAENVKEVANIVYSEGR